MNRAGLITGAGVLGWLIAALMLGFDAITSPMGTLVGIPFAIVYLVIGLALLRFSTLWPASSWAFAINSLAWGAGISLLLVFGPGSSWVSLAEKCGLQDLAASFGGAIPEEIAKAFGAFVVLYSYRALNRPWHGLVVGGLVGLGFEVTENLGYGAFGALMDANSDVAGALSMWGLRTLAGPGLHVVLAAMSGWGIGLALFCVGRLHSLWWVGWSMLLHFIWNNTYVTGTAQYVQIGILMVAMYASGGYALTRAIKLKNSDKTYVLLM